MFTVNYCGREVGSREERSCIIVAYTFVHSVWGAQIHVRFVT